MVDPSQGWALVTGKVLHTSDGGQTWEQIPWPDNPTSVRQFSFTSPQSGWAIIDGRLRRSTDGGRTWTDMNAKLAAG
jgi:photosystem II stability/assembly factor-like uncharacterized protein